MRRTIGVVLGVAGHACAPLGSSAAPQTVIARADAPAEVEASVVPWSTLRLEIAAVICVRKRGIGVTKRFALGERRACGLDPPVTPVQRAVVAAFEDAQPILVAWLTNERDAAEAALQALTAGPPIRANETGGVLGRRRRPRRTG